MPVGAIIKENILKREIETLQLKILNRSLFVKLDINTASCSKKKMYIWLKRDKVYILSIYTFQLGN